MCAFRHCVFRQRVRRGVSENRPRSTQYRKPFSTALRTTQGGTDFPGSDVIALAAISAGKSTASIPRCTSERSL